MKLKELLKILETTAQESGTSIPYICGGVPRDKVLKRLDRIEDLDLTTGDRSVGFLAKDFQRILSSKYKVQTKVGNDGHISIFAGKLKLDFSSNFIVPGIETYLFKRGIKKPTEMEKELFSRDFTCNSLLMTLNLKEVLDPTKQGFEDIKNKVIRTCLSPEVTLTSNKNRVVRAIYLAVKLDFELDPELAAWIKAHPESIKFASEKALVEKLNKAMEYNPEKTVNYLTKLNLWDYIPITEKLYPYYMQRTKAGL